MNVRRVLRLAWVALALAGCKTKPDTSVSESSAFKVDPEEFRIALAKEVLYARDTGWLARRSEECGLWDGHYWRYEVGKMANRYRRQAPWRDYRIGEAGRLWGPQDVTLGDAMLQAFDSGYSGEVSGELDQSTMYANLPCSVAYAKGLDRLQGLADMPWF